MRGCSVGQAGTQSGFLRSGATLECSGLAPLWPDLASSITKRRQAAALQGGASLVITSERSNRRGCGSGKWDWSSRRASGGNLHHALCSKACSRAHIGDATPLLLQHKWLQVLQNSAAYISDRQWRQ